MTSSIAAAEPRSRYYAVGLTKFAVLTLASFGLYLLYWFYRQWKHEQARTREPIWPFARAFFSIFYVYSLCRRIGDVADLVRVVPPSAPGLIAVLYCLVCASWLLPDPYPLLGLPGMLVLLPVQAAINRINLAKSPGADDNRRFTAWNGALIMFGGLVYAIVFAGLLVSPETTTEPTIVVASDEQSQLTVPAGWVIGADLNGEAEIQVANLKRNSYLVVLTEPKSDFADDLGFMEFSRLTLESMLEDSDAEPMAGPTDLIINGRQAIQYEFTMTSDRMRIAYLHTTVDGTESFYQIVAWTARSSFEQNRGVLQQVVQSFEETGKGSPARRRSSLLPGLHPSILAGATAHSHAQ